VLAVASDLQKLGWDIQGVASREERTLKSFGVNEGVVIVLLHLVTRLGSMRIYVTVCYRIGPMNHACLIIGSLDIIIRSRSCMLLPLVLIVAWSTKVQGALYIACVLLLVDDNGDPRRPSTDCQVTRHPQRAFSQAGPLTTYLVFPRKMEISPSEPENGPATMGERKSYLAQWHNTLFIPG
jgi:hypothetical protein